MNMNENKEQPMTDPAADNETNAPVTDATVTEATVTEATVTEATVTEATVTEATVTEATVMEATVTESTAADASAAKDSSDEGEMPLSLPKEEAAAEAGTPKSRKKTVFIAVSVAVLAAVLALVGFAVGFAAFTARPIAVELGEKPDYAKLRENSLFPELYEYSTVPEDLSSTGEYEAQLRFFGFLNWKQTVCVKDTVPPQFSLRKMIQLEGTPLRAEDFVLSFEDHSSVTFDFTEAFSAKDAGEYEISVRASDAYGNSSVQTAVLTVWDSIHLISADLNTASPDEYLKELFPEITETVIEETVWNLPGEYTLRAVSEDVGYVWKFRTEDKVRPKVETKNLSVRPGATVKAEDFLAAAEDVSPCTAVFSTEPKTDETGIYRVILKVEDAFGNSTSEWAKVMVCDLPMEYETEYGMTFAVFEEQIFREMPSLKGFFRISEDFYAEYSVTDELLPLGTSVLCYETDFGNHEIKLNVRDTTPPDLAVEDITLYVGDILEAADFVVCCEDVSTVELSVEADGSELAELKEGVYPVTVTAADLSGNIASQNATLTVIHDTEAPVICGAENLFLYTGQECSFLDGVSATDNRDDSVEVVAETDRMDLSAAGTYLLRYTCTDSAGNSAEVTVTVEILPDTEPPVIYGAKNLSILAGDSVSFRKGVYATDAQCGSVDVKIDSSAVNTQAEGVYPVYYTAADPSGNTAYVTVYLTVNALTQDKVNVMADQILSWIITPNMTVYEKAWAVYAWCTGNLQYSTRTSHLMGQFAEAAYSGFTIRSGNCYVYYAVASALLTRAGIENMEIQRDDPNNPHYWNLVKVNGSWYHFDTCPHYSGHWLQSFLLTDAEVRAYSENEVWGYYSFDASLYPATP